MLVLEKIFSGAMSKTFWLELCFFYIKTKLIRVYEKTQESQA